MLDNDGNLRAVLPEGAYGLELIGNCNLLRLRAVSVAFHKGLPSQCSFATAV